MMQLFVLGTILLCEGKLGQVGRAARDRRFEKARRRLDDGELRDETRPEVGKNFQANVSFSADRRRLDDPWTNEAAKLLASDGLAGDWFGWSVAISGTRVVVGASRDDDLGSYSGSAYVFELDEDSETWSQTAKLLPSDGAAADWIGVSVAISGTRIVVGAHRNDDLGSQSGSAYVFDLDDSETWSQTAKLLPSDGAEDDAFGMSVAISGMRIVVGARYDDDLGSDSGSAYVFEYDVNSETWSQTAKLLPSDGAMDDWFGESVAISGTRIVVGAVLDDDLGSDSGSAYVFELDDSETWSQTAKLLPSDGAEGDEFGFRVAISGTRIVVGAWADDDLGTDSGSAYVFELDDSDLWSQTAKLLPSDGAEGDQFGRSVAISGTRIVVGVDESDDLGSNSGSAYVFELDVDSETWSQTAKFLPSDGAEEDEFGYAVAVDDGTVVVGAYADDDDSGTDLGSCYVFDLPKLPTASPTTASPTTLSPTLMRSDDPACPVLALASADQCPDSPGSLGQCNDEALNVGDLCEADGECGTANANNCGGFEVYRVVSWTSPSTSPPTLEPTPRLTFTPNPRPTSPPSIDPTPRPTSTPSPQPTSLPSLDPTPRPTSKPSPRPTSSPTLRPSPVPTSCSNDPTWVKNGDPSKDCDWVSQLVPSRCGTRGADGRDGSEACLNACGCPSPTTASTEQPTSPSPPSSRPTPEATPPPTPFTVDPATTPLPTPRPTTVPTLEPSREPTTAAPVSTPVGGGGGSGGSSDSTPAIAGGVVGGVIVLLIIGLCLWRRRAEPDSAAALRANARETAKFLLTAGSQVPGIGPVCNAAVAVLDECDAMEAKAADIAAAGKRVCNTIELLQILSENAAKLDNDNAKTLVEQHMVELERLLRDFQHAVASFREKGWLRRKWYFLAHTPPLTKLDAQIKDCLDQLGRAYSLANDRRVEKLLQSQKYALEEAMRDQIQTLAAQNNSTAEDAAKRLAEDAAATKAVALEGKVAQDELRIEMNEHFQKLDSKLSGLSSKLSGIESELGRNSSMDEARKRKSDLLKNLEVKLESMEEKPFAVGGQARVHRGRLDGAIVAIKRVSLEGLEEAPREKLVGELVREVGIMVGLSVRGEIVTQVRGIVTDNNFFGIVLEWMDGGSLRKRLDDIKNYPEVSVSQMYAWCRHIALGMEYICAQGVQHRDLKSSNVLLDANNTCKISDFGLAQSDEFRTQVSSRTTKKQEKKDASGTVRFMAPELLQETPCFTEKSDVYAYAMTCFEIVTRKQPWEGLRLEVILGLVVSKQRPSLPAGAPAELVKMIKECWTHAAEDRPTFAAVVGEYFPRKLSTPAFSHEAHEESKQPEPNGHDGDLADVELAADNVAQVSQENVSPC